MTCGINIQLTIEFKYRLFIIWNNKEEYVVHTNLIEKLKIKTIQIITSHIINKQETE